MNLIKISDDFFIIVGDNWSDPYVFFNKTLKELEDTGAIIWSTKPIEFRNNEYVFDSIQELDLYNVKQEVCQTTNSCYDEISIRDIISRSAQYAIDNLVISEEFIQEILTQYLPSRIWQVSFVNGNISIP